LAGGGASQLLPKLWAKLLTLLLMPFHVRALGDATQSSALFPVGTRQSGHLRNGLQTSPQASRLADEPPEKRKEVSNIDKVHEFQGAWSAAGYRCLRSGSSGTDGWGPAFIAPPGGWVTGWQGAGQRGAGRSTCWQTSGSQNSTPHSLFVACQGLAACAFAKRIHGVVRPFRTAVALARRCQAVVSHIHMSNERTLCVQSRNRCKMPISGPG
jgi:hypothetical protein